MGWRGVAASACGGKLDQNLLSLTGFGVNLGVGCEGVRQLALKVVAIHGFQYAIAQDPHLQQGMLSME